MLSGDSNTRLLLGPLNVAIEARGYTRRFKFPTDVQTDAANTRVSPSGPKKGRKVPWGECTIPDWCDHTWFYQHDDGSKSKDRPFGDSIEVNFKFMHSQTELSRVANWADNRMCGRRSRDDRDAFQEQPHLQGRPLVHLGGSRGSVGAGAADTGLARARPLGARRLPRASP